MNNYFSHDSNARNSDKLIPLRSKYGAEGYGIYFMILERLREESDYMSVKDYNMLAFDLRVDAAKVKAVIENYGLFSFTDDGKRFYSESFLRRMREKDEKSEKARNSANSRWNKSERIEEKCERNANASKTDAIKKRKEKVNKENNSSDEELQKKDENPPSPSPDDPVKNQSQDTESQAPPPTPSPERSTPQPPSELSRFTPPTVEEVREYCIERNNGVDPAMFVDFYISKGWKIGNNKMKDWRAAVRTWEAKQREDNASKTGNHSCIQNNGVQKGRYEKLIESGNEALKILGIRDDGN